MYSSRTLPPRPASAAGPADSGGPRLRRTRSLRAPEAGRGFARRRSILRCRASSFFSRAVGPRRVREAEIGFCLSELREGGPVGALREVSFGLVAIGEAGSLLAELSRELAMPVEEPEEDHPAGELRRERVRGCRFSLSFSSRSASAAESSCSVTSLEGWGASAEEEEAPELDRGRDRSMRCFGGRSDDTGDGTSPSADGGDDGESERGDGGMTGMTGCGGGLVRSSENARESAARMEGRG